MNAAAGQALLLLLLMSWSASIQGASPPPPGSFASSPRRELTAPELLDAPDEWIARSLGWAGQMLDRFPPSIPEHPVRRAALIRLDDVLHIESAPANPRVHAFLHQRMEQAVRQIESTTVADGILVWKLYNHGFLVRTPSASFCFDLFPGTPVDGFPVPMSLMERLADQADALFISHRHADHADPRVARLFIDRGKPVVAAEGLWLDDPALLDLTQRLLYPARSTDQLHAVPIRNGSAQLTVVAFPGHQGSVTNNLHLVTSPDGYAVLQTGDQDAPSRPGTDFDWIDQIHLRHKVDILLPNCWSNDLLRLVRGVNPALVITGHENEMGHSVDHREDFTQTYNRLFGCPCPFLVMAWGEAFHHRSQ